MFAETNRPSPDGAHGAKLAQAAEALLAEARLDTIDAAHAVQLATASALLALYWEVRQQRPGTPTGDGVAPPGGAVRCRPYRRQRASEPGA